MSGADNYLEPIFDTQHTVFVMMAKDILSLKEENKALKEQLETKKEPLSVDDDDYKTRLQTPMRKVVENEVRHIMETMLELSVDVGYKDFKASKNPAVSKNITQIINSRNLGLTARYINTLSVNCIRITIDDLD